MSFEEVTWLAQTKFICPTLRPDVLLRPRLAQLLRQNFTTGRVTLVSAPAGYGKTTFLSSLPQIFPEMPLSWITLDEGDNAPLRLIVTITTALKQLNPAIGQGLQTFLVNSTNPPFDLSRLASWLVHEVMASTMCCTIGATRNAWKSCAVAAGQWTKKPLSCYMSKSYRTPRIPAFTSAK